MAKHRAHVCLLLLFSATMQERNRPHEMCYAIVPANKPDAAIESPGASSLTKESVLKAQPDFSIFKGDRLVASIDGARGEFLHTTILGTGLPHLESRPASELEEYLATKFGEELGLEGCTVRLITRQSSPVPVATIEPDKSYNVFFHFRSLHVTIIVQGQPALSMQISYVELFGKSAEEATTDHMQNYVQEFQKTTGQVRTAVQEWLRTKGYTEAFHVTVQVGNSNRADPPTGRLWPVKEFEVFATAKALPSVSCPTCLSSWNQAWCARTGECIDIALGITAEVPEFEFPCEVYHMRFCRSRPDCIDTCPKSDSWVLKRRASFLPYEIVDQMPKGVQTYGVFTNGKYETQRPFEEFRPFLLDREKRYYILSTENDKVVLFSDEKSPRLAVNGSALPASSEVSCMPSSLPMSSLARATPEIAVLIVGAKASSADCCKVICRLVSNSVKQSNIIWMAYTSTHKCQCEGRVFTPDFTTGLAEVFKTILTPNLEQGANERKMKEICEPLECKYDTNRKANTSDLICKSDRVLPTRFQKLVIYVDAHGHAGNFETPRPPFLHITSYIHWEVPDLVPKRELELIPDDWMGILGNHREKEVLIILDSCFATLSLGNVLTPADWSLEYLNPTIEERRQWLQKATPEKREEAGFKLWKDPHTYGDVLLVASSGVTECLEMPRHSNMFTHLLIRKLDERDHQDARPINTIMHALNYEVGHDEGGNGYTFRTTCPLVCASGKALANWRFEDFGLK